MLNERAFLNILWMLRWDSRLAALIHSLKHISHVFFFVWMICWVGISWGEDGMLMWNIKTSKSCEVAQMAARNKKSFLKCYRKMGNSLADIWDRIFFHQINNQRVYFFFQRDFMWNYMNVISSLRPTTRGFLLPADFRCLSSMLEISRLKSERVVGRVWGNVLTSICRGWQLRGIEINWKLIVTLTLLDISFSTNWWILEKFNQNWYRCKLQNELSTLESKIFICKRSSRNFQLNGDLTLWKIFRAIGANCIKHLKFEFYRVKLSRGKNWHRQRKITSFRSSLPTEKSATRSLGRWNWRFLTFLLDWNREDDVRTNREERQVQLSEFIYCIFNDFLRRLEILSIFTRFPHRRSGLI